ncbi:hypothetical protein BO443_160016 [Burkholderia orbicola]
MLYKAGWGVAGPSDRTAYKSRGVEYSLAVESEEYNGAAKSEYIRGVACHVAETQRGLNTGCRQKGAELP